jgi:transcriptional regulator with XRE-family HTH domain
MKLLGKRIRARRRQLRLTQRDIATAATSSFISRIERGHDLPSLEVLHAMAQHLQLTMAELLGDQLLLEAAKLTVLNPARCLAYLEYLPDTSITRFLECLTESVRNPLRPVSPPPNYEMHFLAARVYAHRSHKDRAISTAQTGLQITPKNRPIVRLKLQALLVSSQIEIAFFLTLFGTT